MMKPSIGTRLWRRFKNVLFIAVGITVVEAGVFGYYNHLVVAQPSATGNLGSSTSTPKSNKPQVDSLVKISDRPVSAIAMTDDGQLAAYGDGNESTTLVIKNLKTQATLYTTKESAKIIYLQWINDTELFIGLKEPHQNTSDLILTTLTLPSKTQRLVHDFTDCSLQTVFLGIAFSPFTNDVYTLIGQSTVTAMYRFDTMSYEHSVPLNVTVAKTPLMYSTSTALFYGDTNNNIWELQNGQFHKFQSQAALLSSYNNTLYYASLNSQGRATSINAFSKGVAKSLYTLSTPVPPQDIVVRQNGTALIYNGSQFYDTSSKKNHGIPSSSTVTVTHNAMFVTNSKGTYWILGS